MYRPARTTESTGLPTVRRIHAAHGAMVGRALAVDGGNTKTIALVVALDGTILGAGRGGCSDLYNAIPDLENPDAATPELAALANIRHSVADALRHASVSPAELSVGVFNMAGADWPEDLAFWRNALTGQDFGRELLVQNDALGILYAVSPEATGVSVICGTGAATGARAPDGRVWHSSFWQDETQGSMNLGQKTLFAIYRAALGIDEPTSLTDRVLAYLGVSSVEEALHLFNNRKRQAPVTVDHLTPILLDEAHAGDPVALRVTQAHGAGLGDIALAAARKVELTHLAFPLVLAGGVFRHPTSVLEDAIVARVRSEAPGAQPVRSSVEPIVGVALQALAAAGVTPDQATFDRVVATLPEANLFATIPAWVSRFS